MLGDLHAQIAEGIHYMYVLMDVSPIQCQGIKALKDLNFVL